MRREGFGSAVQRVNDHLPVGSTRLSSRPGAGGAQCQGPTRIWAVSGRGKSRGTLESKSTLSILTRDGQRLASGFKGTMESRKKPESAISEELVEPSEILLNGFWRWWPLLSRSNYHISWKKAGGCDFCVYIKWLINWSRCWGDKTRTCFKQLRFCSDLSARWCIAVGKRTMRRYTS